MKALKNQNRQLGQPCGSRRATALGRWLIFFAMVLIAVAAWRYWESGRHTVPAKTNELVATNALSARTVEILNSLSAPVELRFYVASDPTTYPESLRAFAAQASWLLGEYAHVSDGKVILKQLDPQKSSDARASAGADGVLPFANANGDICYFGVAIIQGNRKETMPQLAADWEPALEADLSRAILRVTTASPAVTARSGVTTATPKPVDLAVSEELLKTFPNLATRSFDEMAQELRENALTELKSATLEMQAQVERAQQALAAARQDKSGAEQQEALQEFQKVQSAQAAKIQNITARLQDRITVLQQLQAAVPTTRVVQPQ